MRKILFLTGTRADYGKLKSLMKKVDNDSNFQLYVFVTGMHMLSRYGSTWHEIEKDGFTNVYHYINQSINTTMDIALSNTILGLSNYISEFKPDMIVVHGDRLEAMAGAIVGAFNNIRVIHIEGGEVTGTIDESIRHAITKLAHVHLVSNEKSKKRIVQMGENPKNVFVIGSPDIDIMYSKNLPSLEEVKRHYDIDFEEFAIATYHPVTTEIDKLALNIKAFVDALIQSKENYIVIYPNNDLGSEIIINEYNRLRVLPNFKIYPSIRFEYFLTLMKFAIFMIGNSSAGIREAGTYGTPSIDLGNRQKGRYIPDGVYIQHISENSQSILEAINHIPSEKNVISYLYGEGNSDEKFMGILKNDYVWNLDIQKRFLDMLENEVVVLNDQM